MLNDSVEEEICCAFVRNPTRGGYSHTARCHADRAIGKLRAHFNIPDDEKIADAPVSRRGWVLLDKGVSVKLTYNFRNGLPALFVRKHGKLVAQAGWSPPE